MKELFQKDDVKEYYEVPVVKGPVNGIVKVPGSKSMTNRALLLAALSKGKSTLYGVLFSEDSRNFLRCLMDLGFEVIQDEKNKTVDITGCAGQIPLKQGEIYVGSAGTAARFLTAMLAFSSGEYTIQCSNQMKKRPMKPLFQALILAGAQIEYLEEVGYLPIKIIGNQGNCDEINMNITQSTQFLSALLMVASMTKKDMKIHITSEKKDGAYIRITRNMLEEFGIKVVFTGEDYIVKGNIQPQITKYTIEPDVSAACYFYGIALLTGGNIKVAGVHKNLMQGDMKFIEALGRMGCTIQEDKDGIRVIGPRGGKFSGIDIDMNDFSDQALTMAVIAAYGESDTVIRNIGHIKGQECNRMEAIVNELSRAGINCSMDQDNIYIYGGCVQAAEIETYDDHRVAMAFSLLGIRTYGIKIIDPKCCKKTFENYFEVLDSLLTKI